MTFSSHTNVHIFQQTLGVRYIESALIVSSETCKEV